MSWHSIVLITLRLHPNLLGSLINPLLLFQLLICRIRQSFFRYRKGQSFGNLDQFLHGKIIRTAQICNKAFLRVEQIDNFIVDGSEPLRVVRSRNHIGLYAPDLRMLD